LTETAHAAADGPAGVMAAVDLGSNSFHMVVARTHDGQLTIVDRLREMVRLASGLNDYGYLDNASQDRALGCLRRFGQRLRDMRADKVRVVGTNTLRRARNASGFLVAAEEALGHPVEVISGMEEARLVYLGVSHHIDSANDRNLVVDIGGGSTELIIGEGFEPRRLESLAIGCVGLSREYFDDGRLSDKRFERARLAVRLELRPIGATFRRLGWVKAIGSSGTIKTAGTIARELGLIESGITARALEVVIAQMIRAKHIEDLRLPCLGVERAPVFAGGVAILVEILGSLGIETMEISEGALREGLLYDMLGRLQREDARERSIRAMQARYHVDDEQALRVESTALMLLGQVAQAWALEGDKYRLLLQWAARLHEVGLDIAHARYHQHGGYLLANADLPGFVRLEQQLLATLVGFHRRKLDELNLETLPGNWRAPLFKLIVLLRLAVLLNRARSPVELPQLRPVGGVNSLELNIAKGWIANNPLTQADLSQEQEFLQSRGFELSLGLLQEA
jgi:exopolyphosphatase / guanosine-5'-triphosphate,3'-diphosphate pyrophosphatase